jgi:adhesin/invasin
VPDTEERRIDAAVGAAAREMPDVPVRWDRVDEVARRRTRLGLVYMLAVAVGVAVIAAGAIVFGLVHFAGGASPLPLPGLIAVPPVTGKSEVVALAALRRADLTAASAGSCATRPDLATVSAQVPSAGSYVASGATVTLTYEKSLTTPTIAPTTVTAGRRAQATVTVAVHDGRAGAYTCEPVTLTPASLAPATVGPVTNHGDGTYSATVTSTGAPGFAQIVAGDGTLTTRTATLTINSAPPPPPARITVSVGALAVGGTVTAAIRIDDAQTSPVPANQVQVSVSGAAQQAGAVSTTGGSIYSVPVKGVAVGPATITVAAGGAKISQTILVTPFTVALSVAPAMIVADGSQQAIATVTVTAPNGSGAANQAPQLALPSGLSAAGSWTYARGGRYTEALTATKPGPYTVGASVAGIPASSSQTLTATPPPATVELSAAEIVNGGPVQEVATVKVNNFTGAPLAGLNDVGLALMRGVAWGPATSAVGGTYLFDITPNTGKTGTVMVQATIGLVNSGASVPLTIDPPPGVALSLSKPVQVTGGGYTVTATVTVTGPAARVIAAGDVTILPTPAAGLTAGTLVGQQGTFTETLTANGPGSWQLDATADGAHAAAPQTLTFPAQTTSTATTPPPKPRG